MGAGEGRKPSVVDDVFVVAGNVQDEIGQTRVEAGLTTKTRRDAATRECLVVVVVVVDDASGW